MAASAAIQPRAGAAGEGRGSRGGRWAGRCDVGGAGRGSRGRWWAGRCDAGARGGAGAVGRGRACGCWRRLLRARRRGSREEAFAGGRWRGAGRRGAVTGPGEGLRGSGGAGGGGGRGRGRREEGAARSARRQGLCQPPQQGRFPSVRFGGVSSLSRFPERPSGGRGRALGAGPGFAARIGRCPAGPPIAGWGAARPSARPFWLWLLFLRVRKLVGGPVFLLSRSFN